MAREEDHPWRFGVATANAGALIVLLAVGAAFVLLVAQRHTDFGPYNRGVTAGGTEDALGDRSFMIGRGMSALLFGLAGWYLMRHRPRVALGPLVMAAGVGNALAVAGAQVVVLSQFGGHDLPGAAVCGSSIGDRPSSRSRCQPSSCFFRREGGRRGLCGGSPS